MWTTQRWYQETLVVSSASKHLRKHIRIPKSFPVTIIIIIIIIIIAFIIIIIIIIIINTLMFILMWKLFDFFWCNNNNGDKLVEDFILHKAIKLSSLKGSFKT